MFINYYECPCGTAWEDRHSSTVDDDCPSCGTSCSPDESDDADPE
ncbi:rubrerythrin [Brevundimonas nasdae]|nr:rubrerythrin [Brevundimonas nasdae]